MVTFKKLGFTVDDMRKLQQAGLARMSQVQIRMRGAAKGYRLEDRWSVFGVDTYRRNRVELLRQAEAILKLARSSEDEFEVFLGPSDRIAKIASIKVVKP